MAQKNWRQPGEYTDTLFVANRGGTIYTLVVANMDPGQKTPAELSIRVDGLWVQRIGSVAAVPPKESVKTYQSPSNIAVEKLPQRWQKGIASERVAYQDGGLRIRGDGATVNTVVTGSYVYLFQLRPEKIDSGLFSAGDSRYLVVEGNLVAGGLTIGLIANDQWVETVNVVAPGPFRAIIRASGAGAFTATIANNNPTQVKPTQFSIETFRWLN